MRCGLLARIHDVMTLRWTVVAASAAGLAIVCLSSQLIASIIGVVTIGAVVFDVIVHDAPKPVRRRRDKLVVDLVNRGRR